MTFGEKIEAWDRQLFLAINGFHSEFFDRFFLLATDRLFWIPVYLLFLYLIIRKFGWKALLLNLPFIALLIAATDQGSVHLFKNYFARYRPCYNEEIGRLVHLVKDSCGGLYGFVSSHAANVAGVAVFMGLLIKKRWLWLLLTLWLLVVAYSRVYLGVHYPLDVTVGALFGAVAGSVVFLLFWLTAHKLNLIRS